MEVVPFTPKVSAKETPAKKVVDKAPAKQPDSGAEVVVEDSPVPKPSEKVSGDEEFVPPPDSPEWLDPRPRLGSGAPRITVVVDGDLAKLESSAATAYAHIKAMTREAAKTPATPQGPKAGKAGSARKGAGGDSVKPSTRELAPPLNLTVFLEQLGDPSFVTPKGIWSRYPSFGEMARFHPVGRGPLEGILPLPRHVLWEGTKSKVGAQALAAARRRCTP